VIAFAVLRRRGEQARLRAATAGQLQAAH
jgi:hypothetical protein